MISAAGYFTMKGIMPRSIFSMNYMVL